MKRKHEDCLIESHDEEYEEKHKENMTKKHEDCLIKNHDEKT